MKRYLALVLLFGIMVGCEGDYTIYDMHPPEVVYVEVPTEVIVEVPVEVPVEAYRPSGLPSISPCVASGRHDHPRRRT